MEDERSKAFALQLKLDEALRGREAGQEELLKKVEEEKEEIEDRYIDQIKVLKAENYKAEEAHLKEVEEVRSELEELRAFYEKNATSKSSKGNQEAEKRVKELSNQIEMMNKEKIQLIEKYKKEKAEVVTSCEGRFQNLNIYIQEPYGKNHQLTAENQKMATRFNKLKEKLTMLGSNFKNRSTHSTHGLSPKSELKQLLANLNLFSGTSSEAAPEKTSSRSRDDIKGENVTKTEENNRQGELLVDNLNKGPRTLEAKSAVPFGNSTKEKSSPPKTPFSAGRKPVQKESNKKASPPISQEETDKPSANFWAEAGVNEEENVTQSPVARRSPTIKEIQPSSLKTGLKKFLEDNTEAVFNWNNGDEKQINSPVKSPQKSPEKKSIITAVPIDEPDLIVEDVGVDLDQVKSVDKSSDFNKLSRQSPEQHRAGPVTNNFNQKPRKQFES